MARKDIVNNMKTFRFCHLLLAAGICLLAGAARCFTVVDEDEQANYMEALFRVFAHESWCRGFHWWKWDQNSPTKPDSTREGTLARNFTFRGKKAEAVFRRWARK